MQTVVAAFVVPALLVLGKVFSAKWMRLRSAKRCQWLILCLHRILQDQIIVAEKSDLRRWNQFSAQHVQDGSISALAAQGSIARQKTSLNNGQWGIWDQTVQSFTASPSQTHSLLWVGSAWLVDLPHPVGPWWGRGCWPRADSRVQPPGIWNQMDTSERGCFGPHRSQEVHMWHHGHLRQQQQGQLSLSHCIGFGLNLPLCVSPNTARYHGDGCTTSLRLFYLNIAKEIANAWDSGSEN